jgi:hypothetical protein
MENGRQNPDARGIMAIALLGVSTWIVLRTRLLILGCEKQEQELMNEEEHTEQCNKYYDDAGLIWLAIDDSHKLGMHIEFIMSFMEEFERSKDILKSIYYAKCEWDL